MKWFCLKIRIFNNKMKKIGMIKVYFSKNGYFFLKFSQFKNKRKTNNKK